MVRWVWMSGWIIGIWRELATWLGGSGCLGGYVSDLQYNPCKICLPISKKQKTLV